MTYEDFVTQELRDIGIDTVDELFSLGFEPVVVNGHWTWTQRVNVPPTSTPTKPYTFVSVLVPLN